MNEELSWLGCDFGRVEKEDENMPLFRRREADRGVIDPAAVKVSQADITNGFGDDIGLGPLDWIATTPMNLMVRDPLSAGLPPLGADIETVYRIASAMSESREKFRLPRDGVYCPICHHANVQATLLRTPCPRCGRPLLAFGWD